MSTEFEDHVATLTPDWIMDRFPATNLDRCGRLEYADYRTRFGFVRWQYDSSSKSFMLWMNAYPIIYSEVTRLQFYRICDAIELVVPNDDRSSEDDL